MAYALDSVIDPYQLLTCSGCTRRLCIGSTMRPECMILLELKGFYIPARSKFRRLYASAIHNAYWIWFGVKFKKQFRGATYGLVTEEQGIANATNLLNGAHNRKYTTIEDRWHRYPEFQNVKISEGYALAKVRELDKLADANIRQENSASSRASSFCKFDATASNKPRAWPPFQRRR